MLFLKPHHFYRKPEFYLVWWVYGSTYITANTTETYCINHGFNPYYPKLFLTFLINMCASIVKDRALAIMFASAKSESKKFPLQSYGIFFVRDVLTILFGFNLPH